MPLDKLQRYDQVCKGLVLTAASLPLLPKAMSVITGGWVKTFAALWKLPIDQLKGPLHSMNEWINNVNGGNLQFIPSSGEWINESGNVVNKIENAKDALQAITAVGLTGAAHVGLVKGIRAVKDMASSIFKEKGKKVNTNDTDKPWNQPNDIEDEPMVEEAKVEEPVIDKPIEETKVLETPEEVPIEEAKVEESPAENTSEKEEDISLNDMHYGNKKVNFEEEKSSLTDEEKKALTDSLPILEMKLKMKSDKCIKLNQELENMNRQAQETYIDKNAFQKLEEEFNIAEKEHNEVLKTFREVEALKNGKKIKNIDSTVADVVQIRDELEEEFYHKNSDEQRQVYEQLEQMQRNLDDPYPEYLVSREDFDKKKIKYENLEKQVKDFESDKLILNNMVKSNEEGGKTL